MRYSLSVEMGSDNTIIKLLADKDIALEFYAALCNMQWRKQVVLPDDERIIKRLKGDDITVWSCSWRAAGGIIAEIRNSAYNVNEDYLDYYCGGNEGFVSQIVSDNFERLGWKPEEYGDDI